MVDAPLVEGCFVSGAWFDQGVRRDAAARVVAGESASAVARDLGCCRGSVSLWCHEAGVELVGGRRGGTAQSDQARRAKVVQAVLAGQTLPQAAAAAGVSRDSARRYWHDQAMEDAATASGRSSRRRGCEGLVGVGLLGAGRARAARQRRRAGPDRSGPGPWGLGRGHRPLSGAVPSDRLTGDRPQHRL